MNEKNRMEEEWRTVVEYEDYEVSSLGRVRSLKSGKVRYMKCQKNKQGYMRIRLRKNGERKTCFTHRLVYEAFNGTIPEGMQIDHIDGDKSNNTISNLRAVTPLENSNNPVTRARHLEALKKLTSSEQWRQRNRELAQRNQRNPEWLKKVRETIKRLSQNQDWQAKRQEALRRVLGRPIVQLDKKTDKVIRRWECMSDASRELGVYQQNISLCCRGKCKSAYGFRWRYDDD